MEVFGRPSRIMAPRSGATEGNGDGAGVDSVVFKFAEVELSGGTVELRLPPGPHRAGLLGSVNIRLHDRSPPDLPDLRSER